MTKGIATDYGAITDRQRETWATGDFHEIAQQNVSMAEELCKAADPSPGQRVLDVACGSGNAALVAARRSRSSACSLHLIRRGRRTSCFGSVARGAQSAWPLRYRRGGPAISSPPTASASHHRPA